MRALTASRTGEAMRLGLAFLLALGLAGPAHGQQFDQSQLIEALRPRMAPRPLTGDERKQAAAAIAALKAEPAADAIARVRPFAEAGDATALRAMMDAYGVLEERARTLTWSVLPNSFRGLPWNMASESARVIGGSDPEPVDILALPEDVYRPLEALWAAALWRSTGTGEWAVSAAISRCLPPWERGHSADGTRIRIVGRFRSQDCGFDITLIEGMKRVEAIRKIPAKARATALVERPALPLVEIQRLRLDTIAAHMRAGGLPSIDSIQILDYAWARQLGMQVPAFRQTFGDAAFAFLKARKALRSHVAPNSLMMAHIAASPERLAEFNSWPVDLAEAQAQQRAAFEPENRRFDAAIAARSYTPSDRYWMARVGLRERGLRAQQYWAAFGRDEPGTLTPYWCGAGVQAACDSVQAIQRSIEAGPRGEASSASYPGMPDLGAQMEAFRKREASINQANCARASMGAIIACNR